MTFDATNRKAIREREKQAKQREEQRRNYTRHIMSDRFGREWMHDLLLRCHLFATAFVAGQSDTTAFQLGEQNIGLQALADIMVAAPHDYPLMMQEAQTREEANDRRDSNHRSTDGEHPGSADPGRDVEGREPGSADDPEARLDPGPEDGWLN